MRRLFRAGNARRRVMPHGLTLAQPRKHAWRKE